MQALAIFVFYSLIFTAVGPESFRTGMFSLYPVLVLCAAFALVSLCGLVARLLRTSAAGRVAAALFRRASRRALVPLAGLALLEFAFYSLLFTAVGPESFRTGMYSLYPALLVCTALAVVQGCWLLFGLLRQPETRRERLAVVAAAMIVALLMAGQLAWAKDSMERKARSIDELNAFYTTLREKVLPLLGPDPVIMARDVHELHALTGVRCVQIPYENEPAIRATAQRYGVTHILLIGDPDQPSLRPGLKNIDQLPYYELQTSGKASGQLVRIYRIKPA
jgi:hypothetical protein